MRADESGFGIVESMVAITLLAVALLGLAQLMFGAMSALEATRRRSVFVEVATAQMERIRATPYDEVCVTSAQLAASGIYTGTSFEGRTAAGPATATATCSVEPRSDEPTTDRSTAHTVRRWVTFTDTAGGGGSSSERFKRLTVEVAWQDQSGADRSLRLASVLYPGGRGDEPVGNARPVAVASASPESGALAGDSISFSASGSSDAEGDALTYRWDFGDGSAPVAGANVVHAYSSPGAYSAQVEVTDPAGAVAYAVVDVSVGAASGNFPPNAVLTTASATTGTAPLTVVVDASGSSDPDLGDAIVEYRIEWGDGTPPTTGSISASHDYNTVGTFDIVLTVTDTGGLTARASLTVTTVPLDCAITGGSFRNPSTNTVTNDIKVNGSGRPSNSSFSFQSTTNSACTTLRASLPLASGSSLVANLTLQDDAGGTRTWAGTASTGNRFSLGAGQVGVLRATSTGGGPEVQRGIDFTVRR